MNLDNIIKSTQHLEFINDVDNLVHKLLYSKEVGYINLNSKTALKELEKYILRFDSEAEKIKRNSKTENKDEIISYKKENFLKKVKEHFENQSSIWAQEVYQNRIENCLFQASINKNDKTKLDEIYSNGLCAISWISEIKEQSELERKALKDNFNLEFGYALKADDGQYLKEETNKKTNTKRFLELYEMIINKPDKFIDYNLNSETEELNPRDILNLKQKQNDLKTYKKTNVIDEINLVTYTLKTAGIKSDDEKYRFIKELEDDFNLFNFNNKKIDEEDKISIIKRRINLFNKKNKEEYYKNKLFK